MIKKNNKNTFKYRNNILYNLFGGVINEKKFIGDFEQRYNRTLELQKNIDVLQKEIKNILVEIKKVRKQKLGDDDGDDDDGDDDDVQYKPLEEIEEKLLYIENEHEKEFNKAGIMKDVDVFAAHREKLINYIKSEISKLDNEIEKKKKYNSNIADACIIKNIKCQTRYFLSFIFITIGVFTYYKLIKELYYILFKRTFVKKHQMFLKKNKSEKDLIENNNYFCILPNEEECDKFIENSYKCQYKMVDPYTKEGKTYYLTKSANSKEQCEEIRKSLENRYIPVKTDINGDIYSNNNYNYKKLKNLLIILFIYIVIILGIFLKYKNELIDYLNFN